jgi:hypothetical protein
MKPKDVPQCVERLAAHPVLGPRYGNLIQHFPAAIHSVLGSDGLSTAVFEEFHGSTIRFIGVGLAVVVSDDFLRELKTTPLFWLGPELVKRIAGGNSPLLSDAQVRDANSTEGLNLVVWHNTILPKDMASPELATPAMTAFEQHWRGYRLREVVGQADTLEHFYGMRSAGGLYFRRIENRYGDFPEVTAHDFSSEPRNVGMSRDLALSHGHGVSWLGTLFVYYAPPQFFFNRSEQRLLSSALDGGTDEELGDDLGISLSAVKKTWRTIYDRVSACQPELVPTNSQSEEWTQDRGKQKKQRLLAYLREHPEELRPVSRKLLQQEAARRRPSAGPKSVFDSSA